MINPARSDVVASGPVHSCPYIPLASCGLELFPSVWYCHVPVNADDFQHFSRKDLAADDHVSRHTF
jgi:hypothetical protein